MKLFKYNSDKLQFEPLTRDYGVVFLKIALVFFLIITFLGLTHAPRDPEIITETEKVLIIEEANEFSEEKLGYSSSRTLEGYVAEWLGGE